MPSKGTATDRTAQIARIAWLVTFVVPLVLSALLLAAKSTPAAPVVPGAVPLSFEEGEYEDEEEGEYGEGECEIAEEELEEGLLGEGDVEEICAEAETEEASEKEEGAGKCPLRSARGHAATTGNKLKVVIGYTTYEPVKAKIQIRNVGSFKRHLGKSGVLRIVKRIGRKLQAKRLAVRFRISGSPRSCMKSQVKTIQIH